MPPNSAEPEKYSLDDMLDRLQTRSPAEDGGEGELVTRADGTQAIKVRKRKRRSKQPHKEAAKKSARLRIIQIASAITVLVLLGLTLGGLLVYINSAPYRAGVVAKFGAATGAETELIQFRSNPAASRVVRANFRWPEGNILKFLSLVGVQANAPLGGMAGSRWNADEVSAESATLHLDTPRSGEPLRAFPPAAGTPSVSINRLAVNSLDVTVGDPVNPALQLLRTEASFYPETLEDSHPSVRLFRGDVKISGWPDLRLSRALLEFSQPLTEVITLRLLHPTENTGAIDLSGKFDPYATTGAQSLDVKLDSFVLSGITGPSLGRLVTGRVNSRPSPDGNKFTLSSEHAGGKLSVAFSAMPAGALQLRGLPFLSVLSQATGDPWFIEPTMDDGCTGILVREKGGILLDDLAFEEKNHLSLSGNLKLEANDALSGTLRIGLPDPIVTASANPALTRAFSETKDGLRWVTIKVSGTGLRPRDNFREIYQGEVTESKPNAPSGNLFEDLTTPGK